MTNRRMFLTMLFGAVFRRRSRAVMAVVASVVGATTLFCLAAICLTVPQQMNEEMRSYGANLIVTGQATNGEGSGTGNGSETGADSGTGTGSGIGMDSDTGIGSGIGADSGTGADPDAAAMGDTGMDAATVAVVTREVDAVGDARHATYRYETVRINSAPYVLAGIDVYEVQALNRHWIVDGDWPSAGQVMVGSDVADAMGLQIGSTVTIGYRADDAGDAASDTVAGQTRDGRVSTDILETDGVDYRVAGILDTGGNEDGIIYATSADVTALAGDRGPDVIEFSSDADGERLGELVDAINDGPLDVSARQVSKMTSSNQRIVAMLQTLFWLVSIVVLALTLVGVSTTMSSIVSQRRNEIGLRKALGAPSSSVVAEFAVESALYGLTGGVIGTGIGYALARMLCGTVFERTLAFNWTLGALTVAMSMAIAVVASIPPIRRATRIDPAVVLREE